MRNYTAGMVLSYFDRSGRKRKYFWQRALPLLVFFIAASAGLLAQNVSVYVDPVSSILKQDDTLTVRVKYDDGGVSRNLRGYAATVSFDSSLITAGTDDVTEGGFLKSSGDTRYYELDNGGTSITVESALLSGTGGVNGSGTLFSVRFKGKTGVEGSSPVLLVNVILRDNNNNDITADTTRGTIYVESLKPDNVTGFSAVPGHEKVCLNWLNPAEFYRVKIMRKSRGGTYPDNYPEYCGCAPPCPLTYNDAVSDGWTEVYDGTGESHTDAVLVDRDICHYAAYTYDDAVPAHFSDGTAGSTCCATCYYLGDFHDSAITLPPTDSWNPDGFVEFNDLSIFSLTYYKTIHEGADEWWNVCDIGPTDPPSGSCYWLKPPNPDGKIDFDDLMVFSNIWHTVVPKKAVPDDETGSGGGESSVSLQKTSEGEAGERYVTVSVNLKQHDSVLKGIKAVLKFDSSRMKMISVNKGSFIKQQTSPVFFKSVGKGDYLFIDAAVLGTNIGFCGSGAVADILFENKGKDVVDIAFEEIDLRSITNSRILPELHNYTGNAVPEQFYMSQNFPNPFNNSTSMQYRVNKPCQVELSIYNSIGQEVCVLEKGYKEAGVYNIQWQGKDTKGLVQPTGIYVVNFHAGSFFCCKKMILLR